MYWVLFFITDHQEILYCYRKKYASSRYWRTIHVTKVCVHHVTIHKRAKKKHHVVNFRLLDYAASPSSAARSPLAVVVRPPRVVASSAACSPRVVGNRPLAQQPLTSSLRPPPPPALFSRSCYLWEDIEISNIEEGRSLNSWLIGL